MKIHRDDVVATGSLEHIRDELRGNGSTALILLVLASIRKAWDDGGDSSRRRRLARIYHDQQLHQAIVHLAGGRALDNEDILVAYTLLDSDARLLVRAARHLDTGQLQTEAVVSLRQLPGRVSLRQLPGRGTKKLSRTEHTGQQYPRQDPGVTILQSV